MRHAREIEYRPGLPTVEQVRAHEGQGGLWMVLGTVTRGGQPIACFYRGDVLLGTWPAKVHSCRPCTIDGTPCAWPGEDRPADPWAAVREAAEPLRVLLASDNSHVGDAARKDMDAFLAILSDDRKERALRALDHGLCYSLTFKPDAAQAQAKPLVDALRRALDHVEDGR